MNKKQLIAVSTVAAVPAMGLLVFLVLGLLQGMLSDEASVSVTLWIVWVIAALASVVISFLPFAIMFFPGLMPEPASGISDSSAGDLPRTSRRPPMDADEDEDLSPEGDDEAADEGEQLFDDDAIEEDFDDEYGDSFDDDDK